MDADLKHHSGEQSMRQQSNDQNTLNPAYGYSEDEFGSFFAPDANSSFNNAWEQTVLDSSVHANGYSQQPQAWNQQPQPLLQNNGYASPFSNSQNFSNYSTYSSNPYPTLPSEPFDPSLPFVSNASALQQTSFVNPNPPNFINGAALQGGTVAPSAIQSYPGAYERFSPRSENTPTPLPPEQPTVTPSVALRNENFYDETTSQIHADKIPSGKPRGLMSMKENLGKATSSDQVSAQLYASGASLESDEPRVVFPRIPPRKSVKEVKRETLNYQSGRPWDVAQRSLLKKIRIKLAPGKRGRPRKDATAPSSAPAPAEMVDLDSSSESSSEESDDDDDAEESEAEEPSPLPKSRPSDVRGALEYDVIKAIWARRDTMLSGAVIKSALSDYLEIVKAVREAYKTATAELASAEAAKSSTDIEKNKAKVSETQATMLLALQLTLKHGHPDIVERFGSSPLLVSIFSMFLLDRAKENDFNSPMSESIVKILSSCTTLNQDLLEKTKLAKMLQRIVRKGNDQVKLLAQQVLDNAAKMSKPKTEDSREAEVKESAKIPVVKAPGAPDAAAGVKRARPGETATNQPLKRPTQAVPPRAGPSLSGNKLAGSASKAIGVKSGAGLKSESKGAASPPSTESPQKPKVVPTKAPSLLSGLKSASKKASTSNDPPKTTTAPVSKASAAKTAPKQDPPKPTPAPAAAPKSAFSFSQTIADLGKPKHLQESKQVAKDLPPETEEEKRKRERKEARRKLRVTFKPDDSLEEVRLFHHDPEEEQGHDRSMLRDVDDMKNEGRMLKLYSQRADLDEEEEYEPEFDDDELIPWSTPTVIDWSDIDPKVVETYYVTRGGPIELTSPEKEAQEQHERKTLIAIYPSLTDIPPSPREPTDPYSGPVFTEKLFGQPDENIRKRIADYYSSRHSQPALGPSNGNAEGIDAILRNLGNQASYSSGPNQQQAQYPPVQPQASSLASNIESIFAQFSSNSAAPNTASQTAALGPSIQAALNIFKSQQPASEQQQAPQANNYTQSAAAPDLSAMLSQLSALTNNQGANDQSTNNQGGERKRPYDGGDNYNSDAKRNKGGLYKYKTQPCRFWREGTCKKGDACTFLHGPE